MIGMNDLLDPSPDDCNHGELDGAEDSQIGFLLFHFGHPCTYCPQSWEGHPQIELQLREVVVGIAAAAVVVVVVAIVDVGK